MEDAATHNVQVKSNSALETQDAFTLQIEPLLNYGSSNENS